MGQIVVACGSELHLQTTEAMYTSKSTMIYQVQGMTEMEASGQNVVASSMATAGMFRSNSIVMYQIQGMAEVETTGQIVVACGSGLHLLARAGTYTPNSSMTYQIHDMAGQLFYLVLSLWNRAIIAFVDIEYIIMI